MTYIEFGEGAGQLQEVILAVPDGGSGGAHLNLIRFPNRPVSRPGETVIGFMVDDVGATVAAMADAGARITVPVMEMADPEKMITTAVRICKPSLINGFVLNASSNKPAMKPIDTASIRPRNSTFRAIAASGSSMEYAITEIRKRM